MPPAPTIRCPWCEHEATDPDGFRTHLMIEHRKSDLADYVLEGCEREQSPEVVVR